MKPGFAFLCLPLILLGSCDTSDEQQASKKQLAPPRGADFAARAFAGQGTPMAQRVATLGFLNKRNNITQDLQMKPGESRRIGPALVRLQACEKTAPWETRPETGAFVQLFVETQTQKNEKPKWLKVFSGWLFKESPSLNVVEHPIYDVWVKNCAMRFPGEEGTPVKDTSAGAGAGASASSPPSSSAPAADSGDVEAAPATNAVRAPVTPAKAAGNGNSAGTTPPAPKPAPKAPAAATPAPKPPAPKTPAG